MKWINHIVVTGAIVFAATGDPLDALFATAGSVLPDKLEGRPPKQKKAYWRWRQRHRTWTHWTVPYLAIIAGLLLLRHHQLISPRFELPFRLVAFVACGAFLHILEDSVCGKVPLISPRRKIGVRLFTVDSPGEYFFVFGLLVLLFCWRFF